MYDESLDQIYKKTTEFGAHFGITQIAALKLRHIKLCENKKFSWILHFRHSNYTKSMQKGMYGENIDQIYEKTKRIWGPFRIHHTN